MPIFDIIDKRGVPMRKTIIISPELSNEYKEHILSLSNTTFGTQVIAFDSYFFPVTTNSDHQIYLAHKILQENDFKYLKDLFSFPLTIKNLIDFNKELQCYNLSYDNLPTETDYDKEIKHALKLLHQSIKPIDSSIQYIAQGLSHAQLTYLKNNNAHEILNDAWSITPKSYDFKSGLNQRQELEGLIQHLLRSNIKDAQVLVPNISDSIPFLKSIFSRLNIPYESKDIKLNEKVYQYLALLDYYQEQSIETIYNVIESQVFALKHPKQLLQYLRFYRATKTQFFDKLDFAEDHYLISEIFKVQNQIQEDHVLVKEALIHLSSLSLKEALAYILETIKSTSPDSALPIQQYLQNTMSALNEETLHIFKQGLNSLIRESFITPFLTLKTYNELPLYPHNNLFILGLSAKNYPAISAPSGILDVSYRKRVKDYPSQDVLNEHQMHYKELFFSKAKHLTLSVHELTFEGKTLEFANRVLDEAKNQNKKFSPWLLSELDPYYKATKKLSPNIAHDLYLDDNGLLRGSVSSFERYVTDPYNYFIEKGLRIKAPIDYNLYPRLRGSINHEVFETGVLDMQENLLPQNDTYVPHFVEMNKKELLKHLDFLKQIDDSGLITPYKKELKVQNDDLFEGIAFTGFIDRIDKLKNDAYLIIDYKSSSHTLSKSELEKGTQLQLLTYVLAFKKTLEDTSSILGSYYYIFDKKKADTPKFKQYSFSKTKGIYATPALTQDDLDRQYSIKGWTYENISPALIPDKLFTGRTLTNIFNLENLDEFVHEMYAHLRSKILNGVLDTEELDLPFRAVDVKGDN